MSRKSVIKISHINAFFINENKMIEKGENAVESGHVASFYYDADAQFLKGTVYASMKAKSYSVEVLLRENGSIASAKCECPRGLVLCHHMAALLLHAHYNVSITDKQCAWSSKKDAKSKDDGVKSVKDLFPSKKFKAVADIPSDLKAKAFELLENQPTKVGFSWNLSPDVEEAPMLVLPTPRDIILSKEFESSQDKEEFFLSKMRMTNEAILSRI